MSSAKYTLFIADLPYNITEADFATVFRPYEGFEAARITHDRKENLVGFVDFNSHETAAHALETLQGYKFDHRSDVGISIQFSRQSGARRPKTRREPDEFSSSIQSASASYYRGLPMMMNPDVTFPHYGAFANATDYQNLYTYLPPDASSTLYVEGLPLDATEREVSHIFRIYRGFQSVRIVPKESKHYPNRTYNLCFVEFNNKYNAYVALQAVQGYPMEPTDTKGLSISFAKTQLKDGRRPGTRSGSSSGEAPMETSDPPLLSTKHPRT